MIVLVCGGRNFIDHGRVWGELQELHDTHKITHVIHGGAKGADSIARAWAQARMGVQDVCCEANWARDGRSAGPKRNAAMLALNPHLIIAYPGGPGTASMVRLAKKYRLPMPIPMRVHDE